MTTIANAINMPTQRTAYTPVLNFGGGTTGITYLFARGAYLLLGTFVWFTCDFKLTSKGSSTGNAQLSNLPFGVSTSICALEMTGSNMSLDGGYTNFVGSASNTTNILVLCESGNNNVTQALTNTNFTNTSSVMIMGLYKTTGVAL